MLQRNIKAEIIETSAKPGYTEFDVSYETFFIIFHETLSFIVCRFKLLTIHCSLLTLLTSPLIWVLFVLYETSFLFQLVVLYFHQPQLFRIWKLKNENIKTQDNIMMSRYFVLSMRKCKTQD